VQGVSARARAAAHADQVRAQLDAVVCARRQAMTAERNDSCVCSACGEGVHCCLVVRVVWLWLASALKRRTVGRLRELFVGGRLHLFAQPRAQASRHCAGHCRPAHSLTRREWFRAYTWSSTTTARETFSRPPDARRHLESKQRTRAQRNTHGASFRYTVHVDFRTETNDGRFGRVVLDRKQ
jgi:hypothetical protein